MQMTSEYEAVGKTSGKEYWVEVYRTRVDAAMARAFGLRQGAFTSEWLVKGEVRPNVWDTIATFTSKAEVTAWLKAN